MNVLIEMAKARKMVENKTLSLDDFEALIIGLFFPRKRLDYSDYIKSPEWKQKAAVAKKRAGYRCQVCNRHKNEVVLDAHHRTYARLGHERPEDITVLCRNCHELYEANKS